MAPLPPHTDIRMQYLVNIALLPPKPYLSGLFFICMSLQLKVGGMPHETMDSSWSTFLHFSYPYNTMSPSVPMYVWN